MSSSEPPEDVLPGRSVVDNSDLLEACDSALRDAYVFLSEEFVPRNEVSGVQMPDLENMTTSMCFVTSQILQTEPPRPEDDPDLIFRRLENLSRMASHLDTFLDEAVVTVARFGSANLDDDRGEEPLVLDYNEAVASLIAHLRPTLHGLKSGKMDVKNLMDIYHARQISGLVHTHGVISKMSAALQNKLDTARYKVSFESAEGHDQHRDAEVARLGVEIDAAKSSLARFTLNPDLRVWSTVRSLHTDLHKIPEIVSSDLEAWEAYWACGRGTRLNYDTISWSTMQGWPHMHENMKDLLDSLEVLSLNGISLKYEPTLDGSISQALLENVRQALSKVKRPDPTMIPLNGRLINEGFKTKILSGGTTKSKCHQKTFGGSSSEEIFDIDVQEYKDYLSKSGPSSLALRADFARLIQNARKPMDDLYRRSVRLVLPEVGLQHAVLGILLEDVDETYVSLFSLLQESDPDMSAEKIKAAPRFQSQANSGSGSRSRKRGKASHRKGKKGKSKKGKGKARSSYQDEHEQEQGDSPEWLSQIREILEGSKYETFNTLAEFSEEWNKRMAVTHLGGMPLSQEARTRIMSGRSSDFSSYRGWHT